MKEYRTISKIAGPAVFVEKTEPIAYGELVNIASPTARPSAARCSTRSDDLVVVQIFETTDRYRQGQRRPVHRRDHQDAGRQGDARPYPVGRR